MTKKVNSISEVLKHWIYRTQQPGDKPWVLPYLGWLCKGEPEGVACGMANVAPSTALRWRAKDARNKNRHTRARREGNSKGLADLHGYVDKAAAGGSAHHLRLKYLRQAPDEWKELMQRGRDAEPDAQSIHVTGDGQNPGSSVTYATLVQGGARRGHFKGKGRAK